MTEEEFRAKVLAIKPRERTVTVDFGDGVKQDVIVEAPSQVSTDHFRKLFSEQGDARARAYLVVACSRHAQTRNFIFKPEDAEEIAKKDANFKAPYYELSFAAMELIQEGVKDVVKKSEPIPGQDFSSK